MANPEGFNQYKKGSGVKPKQHAEVGARSAEALRQIAHAKEGSASQTTQLPGGGHVETWWDRRSRNYVTEAKDAKGYGIEHPRTGENSTYTGHKIDARAAHTNWVEAHREAAKNDAAMTSPAAASREVAAWGRMFAATAKLYPGRK